ncbi:MAG: uncharacterized protein PWP24_1569 [Clostridiales bacterium]|nr:uncharacterized protein [Clostridiales bacterium]
MKDNIPEIFGDKRYYSLDCYLKNTFGEKVYKIALDGGMTCPNRDGTLDTRGCIFCSAGGSGDFAAPMQSSIKEQIDLAITGILASKQKKQKSLSCHKFIAYFQSYTNTYADISYLRNLFTEAIAHPSIVALSIATRPDCLSPEVLDLLEALNQIKPVWVELGLQTIHEKTAAFIRRGYPLATFDQAIKDLNTRNLSIITHLILGLPFENESDMLASIHYVSHLPIHGIKLQLLHVLAGTDLAKQYGTFHILTQEEYIQLIIKCLEHLPPEMVIHRLTGDGPKDSLIAPLWSTKKRHVLNEIQKTLKSNNTWQGKEW